MTPFIPMDSLGMDTAGLDTYPFIAGAAAMNMIAQRDGRADRHGAQLYGPLRSGKRRRRSRLRTSVRRAIIGIIAHRTGVGNSLVEALSGVVRLALIAGVG